MQSSRKGLEGFDCQDSKLESSSVLSLKKSQNMRWSNPIPVWNQLVNTSRIYTSIFNWSFAESMKFRLILCLLTSTSERFSGKNEDFICWIFIEIYFLQSFMSWRWRFHPWTFFCIIPTRENVWFSVYFWKHSDFPPRSKILHNMHYFATEHHVYVLFQ